ncbi:MAG: hypothetical protein ACRDRL_03620 [Sciscionella sp.]
MTATSTRNSPNGGDAPFKARLPLSAAIVATVLFGASLAAGLSYAGYYFLLRPSARLSSINYRDLVEVVKIAFTVVAGVGGTIALTVAVRKQRFAERQHKLSEADADRQDRRILDERFRNAVTQLGERGSAAVRIGGAYALAKLADDWLVERQTCINVLCGYLRFPYESLDDNDEREVRRTIVGIIRQHLLRGAEFSWNGNLFDLTGAVIDHFDLSDIFLEASILRLRGCLLQSGSFSMNMISVVGGEIDARELRIVNGGVLDAQSAYLSEFGEISLAGSTISSGTVTFENAQIESGRLLLDNVKIDDGGALNLSYVKIATVSEDESNLSPLSLDEVDISAGTVNLEHLRILTSSDDSDTTWTGGRKEAPRQLVASFEQIILKDGEISFRHTALPCGHFSFSCAALSGGVLDFGYAKLRDCHLDFSGAKIDGGCINFSGSYIGISLSDKMSPASGFAYEWLENLRNTNDVSSRDMVWQESPFGVVEFLDTELCRGHINFDRVKVRGALLDFPGLQASGGTITFADSMFTYALISLWNARLTGDCKIEIQPVLTQDLTVLYSQAWGGLKDHVVLGERVKLLEVSADD